ncbi:MAG: hypothetical protein ABGY09_06670 [Euryarchaeota archaeon]
MPSFPIRLFRRLKAYVEATYERVAVAYSGGRDSSVLLRAAVKALGRGNVVACTATLPYKPDPAPAPPLDVDQLLVRPDVSEVLSGPDDHPCYACKRAIYTAIMEAVDDVDAVLDGTNVSELARGRPGLRALHELEVDVPLLKCGLGDQTTAWLAARFGLRSRPGSCSLTELPEWPEINGVDPGRANAMARRGGERPDGEWSLSDCLKIRVHAPLPEVRGEGFECVRDGDETLVIVRRGPVTEAVAECFRRCWVV